MTHQFKIVLSQGHRSGQPGIARALGPLDRLKLIFGGIVIAAVVVGVLVLALVLGSIIAAGLWVVLVIASVALILKSAFLRARQ
jgi:hypothetical protein